MLPSQTSTFSSSDLENVPQTVCVLIYSNFCILDKHNEWSTVFSNNDNFVIYFKIQISRRSLWESKLQRLLSDSLLSRRVKGETCSVLKSLLSLEENTYF